MENGLNERRSSGRALTNLVAPAATDGPDAVWRDNSIRSPEPGIASVGSLTASTDLVLLQSRRAADTGAHYTIVIAVAPESGTKRSVGTVVHCGRETTLKPGTGVAIRPEVPFRVDLRAGCSVPYLVATNTDLLHHEPRLQNIAGQPLAGMVPTVVNESWHAARAIGASLGTLERLALALSAQYDKTPSGLLGAAEFYRRALALITQRCTEPDLRAVDIARDLGVGVRQLESMFRRRQTSTLEVLMQARIDALSARITGFPDGDDLDTLAQSAGFYDKSHMNRCWHKVTGTTFTLAPATAA